MPARGEQQDPITPDQLANIGQVFGNHHERLCRIEKAMPEALTDTAKVMRLHSRTLAVLVMAISEIINGSGPDSPLWALRGDLVEIEELEKLLRQDPPKDPSI